MAKAFAKSQFFGFEYHDKAIEGARATASKEGIEVRPQLWRREGQSISRQRLQRLSMFGFDAPELLSASKSPVAVQRSGSFPSRQRFTFRATR
jgi:hypothetical protein